MKDELMKLSQDKGFLSRDAYVNVTLSYYYLWMCELQQWLREKHNILVTIDCDPDVYNGKINYITSVRNCNRNSDALGVRIAHGFSMFQYYETALEQGLFVGLNLIKIIK